jgi:DNA-binding Xre family transcriptional regulator
VPQPLQKLTVRIMHICMKLTSDRKRLFLTDLARCMLQRGWNISELAGFTGIHQSQVSRIIAGNFKTFSSNVMQICIALEMEPKDYYEDTRGDEDRRQIANSAISIWDGTHQDTGVVVSLLREISKLRKQDKRR